MAHNPPLSTIELLSAKLLHDMAGSIGAIAHCVELIEDDGYDMQSDSLKLLKESSEDIINKFKFLRQAYSFSENNINFDQTKNNIEKYLVQKKIALSWQIEESRITNIQIIEKINKIIANVIILSVLFMINGEKISISLLSDNNTKFTIKIRCYAKKISINPNVNDTLFTKKDVELSTQNIHAHFIRLLLKDFCAKMSFEVSSEILEINIVC